MESTVKYSPVPIPFSFTFLTYVYDFLKILRFYKMYILSLIFMVKPIKLYISVFIANSDWNGQKCQH